MNYRIIEERAKVTTIPCGGLESYDAEITIEVNDNGNNKTLYVSANSLDGTHYGLFKTSFFESLNNPDIGADTNQEDEAIEEYESLKECSKSEFFELFKKADALLNDLMNF